MRPPFFLLVGILFLILPTFTASAAPSDEQPLRITPTPNRGFCFSLGDELPFPLNGAGADSFYLYGGPGTEEGRFQTFPTYDPTPDRQGWMGVDLTYQPSQWQVSTFNMENLNYHGTGNQGMWCGQACEDVNGWGHCPGYGNGWYAMLRFEADYWGDLAIGQTVHLEFWFNHDTEPGYDFLSVEYDSAGVWRSVYAISGSNKEESGGVSWPAPGVHYVGDLRYVGNDYGGDQGDQIRIQIVFRSDLLWSDEDGLWPTDGGAAQVDDITVWYDYGLAKAQQVVFEDFEGALPYAWFPECAPFVGEFSEVYPLFEDNDPCTENDTPLMTFLDSGSLSDNWHYGIPGGWVVNYAGGIAGPSAALRNEVWSPPFPWDDPTTTADDDPFCNGSALRFDLWRHLPFANGMFYVWHVRSSLDGGQTWGAWRDHGLVYYSADPKLQSYGDWKPCTYDTSTLIAYNPNGGDLVTHVQIALGVWDLASYFGPPGDDATPSPCFDNVAFIKYFVEGPVFSARSIDLFQDSFPNSGSIDASTAADRDALDCRIDIARDIVGDISIVNVHGDSLVVDIRSVIPGNVIEPFMAVLKWRLDVNPLFEMPLRGMLELSGWNLGPGNAANGQWDAWEGEVYGQAATTSAGDVIPDRYFWDLPDQDFAYPGDILYWYLEVTDSGPNGGNVTTLPPDVDDFGTTGYHRAFTVRFLPSIGEGGQPPILLINDFGHRGGEDALHQAFGQNGYVEGVDYDSYTVKGPTSMVSNGIGAAGCGGAGPYQLTGYSTLIYVSENLAEGLLSDGSGSPPNDKSFDLQLLTAWHELPGDRFAAYFGDNLVSGICGSAAGRTYASTSMGVLLNDHNVHDEINFQQSPHVVPVLPYFAQDFVAMGGCMDLNTFDSIRPGTGAQVGHLFTDRSGMPRPDWPAASVLYDRIVDEGLPTERRLVDLTFPYGFCYIWNVQQKLGQPSARSILLQEAIDYFGSAVVPGGPTHQDPVPARGIHGLTAVPNPFNPSTAVRFTLGANAVVQAQVYDIRGRLVRVLAEGLLTAGPQELVWDGRDQGGATVGSGIYIVRVEGDGDVRHEKIALVK